MSTNRLRATLAAVAAVVIVALPATELTASGSPLGSQRLTCVSCLVVDESGKTLFAREADVPLPNASTTKMMTALVVEGAAELDTETTVSPVAAAVPGGKLGLLAGERWSVEELLKALLLASSNDAAVALAEEVAGSEAAFVAQMNRRAAEMGLSDTIFSTPHGLDAADHASSARDLAVMAKEVLRSPVLGPIVGTTSTTIASSQRTAVLENTNLLLETYPGADGVKTGFTALAGNVMVASAVRHERRLIVVAMHSEDAFADATSLLDIGFAKLRRQVLLVPRSIQDALILDGAGATAVIADGGVRGPQLKETLTFSLRLKPDLSLPLVADQVVGTIVVQDADGGVLDSVPARSSHGLDAVDEDWRTRLITRILGVAGDLVGG